MKISIIGSGIYGISLALNIAENNHTIKMWSENKELVENFEKNHNFKPVTEEKVPENIIMMSSDLKEVIKDADLILFSTSAKYVRSTCLNIKDFYDPKVPICIASKGIENDTCSFLSDVVSDILGTKHVCVISGPSFAVDLITKQPIALSLASTSKKSYLATKNALKNTHVKVRRCKDIYAVQLCGSIKNVIAIAAGILDGLGYQESTRAFLITESLHDIKALLRKMHCRPSSILSYAGMGDLILTCSSTKSRNYSFGVVIGKKSGKEAIKEYLDTHTTEGYYTLLSIKKLTKNKKIKMPIINIMYDICINNKNPEILSEFLINKE